MYKKAKLPLSLPYVRRHSIGISQQYTLGIWKLSLFFYKSVFFRRVQELCVSFTNSRAVLTSTKCLSRWSDSNLTLVLRQKSFRQRIFHFVNRTFDSFLLTQGQQKEKENLTVFQHFPIKIPIFVQKVVFDKTYFEIFDIFKFNPP